MPKTYKTEIIGYSFSELTEKIQQQLWQNDALFACEVDFEPVEEAFREILKEHYGADLETLQIQSDVSYSQGSGACCVGELNVETVLENHVGSYFSKVLELIESGKVVIDTIKIERCGPWNFYCHENTCRVEIEYVDDPTLVDGWPVEEALELEEMLTNAIREELRAFYSDLKDYYEESTSFEAYVEVMHANQNVYTEDGSIVDPAFIENATVIDGYQLKLDFEDHSDYNYT